jgi:hypothetical protein
MSMVNLRTEWGVGVCYEPWVENMQRRNGEGNERERDERNLGTGRLVFSVLDALDVGAHRTKLLLTLFQSFELEAEC